MTSTEEKIVAVISKQKKLKPETIDIDVNPQEAYDLDSLDLVEILVDMEDEFGIDLKVTPTKEINSIRELAVEIDNIISLKKS